MLAKDESKQSDDTAGDGVANKEIAFRKINQNGPITTSFIINV